MTREQAKNLVESTGFRSFIFIVIFINSITIGLQISHFSALVETFPQIMSYLELFDLLCLLIYIVEAALKLYAYGRHYFKSAWNIFDFVIIVLSVLPMLVIMPVPVQFLRIIRLVRVVRVLKVISLFEQMHIIVEAIGKSLSGVAWTALLLLIVIYIYDVIGVATFSEAYPELFGDLAIGAATLLEIALSGWPDIAHDISLNYAWGYFYFVSYVVISALIVLNVVVGIIVDAIQNSAQAERDESSRGLEEVRQKNHVLVLGFNPTTLAILAELIEANMNQTKMQYVVVLDSSDKTEMEEAITAKLGEPATWGNTDILCRTGLIYDVDALSRCAIEGSRSVIINANSDFDVIRSVMACTHVINQAPDCSSYTVATVHNEANVPAISIAGRENAANDCLELISMQDILARIMVNTSRQPGLPAVFTELFNFEGNEFYIIPHDPSFPKLYDQTIEQINLQLKSAFAVGVVRDGSVIVDDPRQVSFVQGDALVVIEDDDDALEVSPNRASIQEIAVQNIVALSPMRALVLGNYPILGNVLREFAHYLPEGSCITVADSFAGNQASNSAHNSVSNSALSEQNLQDAKAMLEAQGISLDVRPCNIYDKHALDQLVGVVDPQSVLVLGEVDSQYAEAEDMRIINLILYLRDHRERTGCTFGVACQINSEANRELIDVTANDDYIVGRHFASLLMTQISQRREMFGLIDTILSSKGFEVYIKKASNYVPTGVSLDLYTVSSAVAARGEIFIGLRQKQGTRYCDPVINPPKHDAATGEVARYNFGEDDFLVVLAEDAS